jgi:hypothetical protein
VVRSNQEVWDRVHFPGYFRVQIISQKMIIIIVTAMETSNLK